MKTRFCYSYHLLIIALKPHYEPFVFKPFYIWQHNDGTFLIHTGQIPYMHLAPALCIVILITAWYAPVLADEPVLADDPAPSLDAVIMAGLENRTVTDEIERVLQDEDALLSFEPACCLVEEQMAGVSHSTYERIKQTYATLERVTNLLESHVKQDSKVDLTFTGMPFESEAWLVRLIVTIVVIVIIIVVVVAAHYASPALVDAAAYANAREAIGAGVVRTIRKMSMPNLGETSIPHILNLEETSIPHILNLEETSIPHILNLEETSSSGSSYILEGVHWSEGSFFHDSDSFWSLLGGERALKTHF